MELLKDFKEREVNNMYKILINELRVLRDVVMNPRYSKNVKFEQYHKTSGFVYGFCYALATLEGTKHITCNMLDLTYDYLTAIYKEII